MASSNEIEQTLKLIDTLGVSIEDLQKADAVRKAGLDSLEQEVYLASEELFSDILAERQHQINKFGHQIYKTPESWFAVLMEEVFEANYEVNDNQVEKLEQELVQVAAVAVGWLAALKVQRKAL